MLSQPGANGRPLPVAVLDCSSAESVRNLLTILAGRFRQVGPNLEELNWILGRTLDRLGVSITWLGYQSARRVVTQIRWGDLGRGEILYRASGAVELQWPFHEIGDTVAQSLEWLRDNVFDFEGAFD